MKKYKDIVVSMRRIIDNFPLPEISMVRALPMIVFIAASLTGIQACARQLLPDYVVNSISIWSQCRASFIRERLDDGGTSKSLADASMKACEPQQSQVLAAYAKYLGPLSASEITKIVESGRENSISAIETARSGEKPQDPIDAWAACVANQSGGVAGEDLDLMVERAFTRCKQSEDLALRAAQARYGIENGPKFMALARPKLKAQLIERLKESLAVQ